MPFAFVAFAMLSAATGPPAGARPAKKLPVAVNVGVVAVEAHQLQLRLSVKTARRARCASQVTARKLRFPLPDLIASKSGRAVVKWTVDAGAPAGSWSFVVKCRRGKDSGSRTRRVEISVPAGDSHPALVAPGSLETETGEFAVAPPSEGPGDGEVGGYGAGNGNPFAAYRGYCTWGAWEHAQWLGRAVTGNAQVWADQAARAGLPVGTTPAVGAVYVRLSPGVGHVAVVTSVVNPTTFKVVEMNGGSGATAANDWRTNEFGQYRYDRVKYTGSNVRFIYPPGTPAASSPAAGAGPAGNGFQVAFQANTGDLWTVGSADNSDRKLGMRAATSPALAALSGGGYEVAFQANTSNLWTVGSADNSDRKLGMREGTSPAIASLASGGYQAAFQANTGDLWTVGSGGDRDWKLGMRDGTSPAITGLAGGGFEAAFQANTSDLWTVGSAGDRDWKLGMMAGTSPSIAALPGGGYQVAFQANTGSLWTVGSAGDRDWKLGMREGTSPAITRWPR
ncbi:MAG TPA: CHAP domain-containing protein [Thermoleophilaceae bacterium]